MNTPPRASLSSPAVRAGPPSRTARAVQPWTAAHPVPCARGATSVYVWRAFASASDRQGLGESTEAYSAARSSPHRSGREAPGGRSKQPAAPRHSALWLVFRPAAKRGAPISRKRNGFFCGGAEVRRIYLGYVCPREMRLIPPLRHQGESTLTPNRRPLLDIGRLAAYVRSYARSTPQDE